MMKFEKMIILNVIILLILVGGGFGVYAYYNNSTNYLSTDNASIAGQPVSIVAPASGKLTNWNGNVGSSFSKDQQIGTILSSETGTAATTNIPVNIPTNGTVVQNNALNDSFVAAGTPLATAYDMKNLWVTANIDETAISDVTSNQDVDIYVDAFPDTPLKGKVDSIGLASAGTFSLLPASNTTSNYTKVTQEIPVKIIIADPKGLHLVPGMNVTVKIHK
ncbi:HlyD family secretion protein [Neobacillus cucumis]|uniref:HlyD family secretion protein n=1 Tax=Neobacillus cucumis TaxID=1740721 RepID=UPI0028533A6E|nr:HlyD family efflux transporter periplasmic adaptor subunit [Neobacillus cucumis]MDR4947050.1 efflux RND transporter periplasmic adaptor subunit [Neobacillus cucumis]